MLLSIPSRLILWAFLLRYLLIQRHSHTAKWHKENKISSTSSWIFQGVTSASSLPGLRLGNQFWSRQIANLYKSPEGCPVSVPELLLVKVRGCGFFQTRRTLFHLSQLSICNVSMIFLPGSICVYCCHIALAALLLCLLPFLHCFRWIRSWIFFWRCSLKVPSTLPIKLNKSEDIPSYKIWFLYVHKW